MFVSIRVLGSHPQIFIRGEAANNDGKIALNYHKFVWLSL